MIDSSCQRSKGRGIITEAVFRGLWRGLVLGAVLSGVIAALVIFGSVGSWLSTPRSGRRSGPLGLAAYLLFYRGSGVGLLVALSFYSGLFGALAGGVRAVWRRGGS